MIDAKTITTLSNYARIGVSQKEEKTVQQELAAVLNYVAMLKGVRGEDAEDQLANQLREDGTPHEGSLFRELLIEQAPATRGGFIATKHVFDKESTRHDRAQ